MSMFTEEELRMGRLATVGRADTPHVVPEANPLPAPLIRIHP